MNENTDSAETNIIDLAPLSRDLKNQCGRGASDLLAYLIEGRQIRNTLFIYPETDMTNPARKFVNCAMISLTDCVAAGRLERIVGAKPIDLSPVKTLLVPDWLTEELDVDSELLPLAESLGFSQANNPAFMKKVKAQNINLFQLLTDDDINFFSRVRNPVDQYSIMVSAFHTIFNHPAQTGSRKITSLNDALSFLYVRQSLIQTALSKHQFRPIPGIDTVENRQFQTKFGTIIRNLNHLGIDTLRILTNPDDPRYQAAIKFMQLKSQSDNYFGINVLSIRLISEEVGQGQTVAAWLREIRAQREENGDQTLTPLIDMVLEKSQLQYGSRLMTTAAVENRFTPGQELAPILTAEEIEAIRRTFINMKPNPVTLSPEVIPESNRPETMDRIILTPIREKDNEWIGSMDIRFKDELSEGKSIRIFINVEEGSIQLMMDTIDPTNINVQLRRRIKQILLSAVRSLPESTPPEPALPTSRQIAPVLTRGPAKFERGVDKRPAASSTATNSNTLSIELPQPTELPGRFKVGLPPDAAEVFTPQEIEEIDLAVTRYENGARRVKVIKGTAGPIHKEIIIELRHGDRRILLEVNPGKSGTGKTVTVLDIINRRDLNTWVKFPKSRSKSTQ